MILAGTTMPPIPRLAIIKINHSVLRLSVRATAIAPQPMQLGYIISFIQMQKYQEPLRTCSHQDAAANHQCLVVSFEQRQQPESDTSTDENTITNRQRTETDGNRIMAVLIETLSGPEENDRKEIGSRDPGDQQSQSQRTWFLDYLCRDHGIFGTVRFPESKGYQDQKAKNQRHQNMGRCPRILRGQSASNSVKFRNNRLGLTW